MSDRNCIWKEKKIYLMRENKQKKKYKDVK